MIGTTNFINTVGEYAYDCLNRSDMLLRDETSNEAMLIATEHGSITVTRNTKIMLDNGMYCNASLIHVGDCLKNQMMNKSVVTGVTCITDECNMLKVVDSKDGYLVVNGFFVAND